MSWPARIAERLIESSRDAGELQGLAGEGRPIDAVETGLDPLEEAGFRLMETEGVVPPEAALMNRASAARSPPRCPKNGARRCPRRARRRCDWPCCRSDGTDCGTERTG